ncbi:cilia- and flagella-associated protein 418 [Octopus bimaculoides]|uniref:Cilia- and flagella-associated protein 418 n=1 Tax=Octopus bimaculoides TaxID=37653 RepID=A0A0L8HWR6_OCTBM|nr:cilia- and flagella-associated protein 418 [Octopus bimaculoides]|eukprot:XP_014768741.1 PREDICTED: protein C8orf37 homolog [Octopus bimaculoides]
MDDGDDIDDLLNEAEQSFNSRFKRQNCRVSNISVVDQLDDLLAETDDIKDYKADKQQKAVNPHSLDEVVKCFPVYLAGSHFPCGLSNISKKLSCDKLRCTSCDMKVLSFEDFAWLSSLDYLFLRNNFPNFKELRSKLKPQNGSRAYCCQCSWQTINTLSLLKQLETKWVCGQH